MMCQSFSITRRHASYWLLVIPAGAVYGIMPGWMSVIPVVLRDLRVPQDITGWIGVAAQFACGILNIVVGLYV